MPKKEEGPDFIEDTKQGLNWLIAFTVIFSRPLEVWLRRPGTCGERHFADLAGLLALFAMPICMTAVDPRESWPFFIMGAMYPVGLIIHRVAGYIRRRNGYRPHSLYVGDSWVDGKTWEVMTLLSMWVLALVISPPFGAYLFLALIGVMAQDGMIRMKEKAVLRARHDAELENEYLATLYDREGR